MLFDFPAFTLDPALLLVRIHKATRRPWWFSSADAARSRRFDLPHPRGTCYPAEDRLGAFVEVFQDAGVAIPVAISFAEIAVRRISRVSAPRTMVLADRASRRAASFGVTGELHSSTERELTQRWAVAFAEAGFDGVRYLLRYDPAQLLIGMALLDDAGERDWPVHSFEPIRADLIVLVQHSFGFRFVQ